jgi:DNA (cytosine-5)-methyltransferase 1
VAVRFLELFAGAGGMSLGLERAGMTCVAHAEIEPHARAVLRHRWPDVPLYGDVTTLDGAALMQARPFDVLTGGSPCQDLSVAGKRAGLDGARSSLFFTQARIWEESGAPYLLWENVYGALSSNDGADFAVVLSTLVGATVPVPRDGWRRGGVASGPAAVAAWRVLDLQHIPGDDWPAPPQRRVRVFVLAARTGGCDPAEILALGEGVCGHPAPREQAREGTARSAAASVDSNLNGYVELSGALGTSPRGRQAVLAFQPGNLSRRAGAESSYDVFPTLGADTTGDQAPHVVTSDARGNGDGATVNTLAGDHQNRVTDYTALCITGPVTHALTHEGADASEDGTGRGTPIVVASGQANAEIGDGVAPTLTLLHEVPYTITGRPRRLTPLECERLMAWGDQHTARGIDEKGREYALSDTARYRLCGNGIGSTQAEWIGRNLMALEAST